jgi:hypothetical protein
LVGANCAPFFIYKWLPIGNRHHRKHTVASNLLVALLRNQLQKMLQELQVLFSWFSP